MPTSPRTNGAIGFLLPCVGGGRRHVKKCRWHVFSVDLGSYAAVASILILKALSYVVRADRVVRPYEVLPCIFHSCRRRRHTKPLHFSLFSLHWKRKSCLLAAFSFSLSKNYANAPVSAIIEETGVFSWKAGEKMHGKSQSS